jgi:peroxiredoxin
MILNTGTRAPDFELTWKIGSPPVRRSTHQEGRPLVLLFFPLAFSSVCTAEICEVSEDWSTWTDLGARMVGISVDSPFVLARFADETGAEFPLLSDFNKTVADSYGILNRDYFGMDGVADRAAFVIDGEGLIRYAWTDPDDSVLPDFDRIRAEVEKLEA